MPLASGNLVGSRPSNVNVSFALGVKHAQRKLLSSLPQLAWIRHQPTVECHQKADGQSSVFLELDCHPTELSTVDCQWQSRSNLHVQSKQTHTHTHTHTAQHNNTNHTTEQRLTQDTLNPKTTTAPTTTTSQDTSQHNTDNMTKATKSQTNM